MTVGQAIQWVRRQLEEVSEGDATADARAFVCAVTGHTPDKVLLRLYDPVQRKQEDQLRDMVLRRNRREPAQYIVGTAQFLGYEIKCDPRALIPRFETEFLALEAFRTSREHGLSTVLDLCTGSGCIAISLSLYGLRTTACDFSEDALMLAQENARTTRAAVEFFQGDLMEALPEGRMFDMIVSNPPYVKSGDLPRLAPEVSAHEPHLALDGGTDGLLFYRRIATECACLRRGGWLLMEIGDGQAGEVTALLSERFEAIEVLPDMRGVDRVVRARRRDADAGEA